MASSDFKSFRDVQASIAHVYETDEAARAKSDEFDLSLDRCAEQLRASLEQSTRESLDEEGRADAAVSALLEPFELPVDADWLSARRVRLEVTTGATFRTVVNFVVLREGRFIATVGYVDHDDENSDVLELVVQAIHEKAQEQDDALTRLRE